MQSPFSQGYPDYPLQFESTWEQDPKTGIITQMRSASPYGNGLINTKDDDQIDDYEEKLMEQLQEYGS